MSDAEPIDARPDADRDALYRQFEASPGDLTGYGAMADKLDELGYPALAHAYRWMMTRGKWPHKRLKYLAGPDTRRVPAKFRWAWYGETRRPPVACKGSTEPAPDPGGVAHWLPELLIPGDQKVYPSHAAAVMDLAKWLARLKGVYDLEPPKRGT